MGNTVLDLEGEVGNRYVAELRQLGHPLAADDRSCEDRMRSAARVVGDVCSELRGEVPPAPSANDVRASLVEFLSSGFGMEDALEANRILFESALPLLTRETQRDAVEVATVLNRRLSRDVSLAMSEARHAGMLQSTSIPVIDTRRLPASFTRREVEIATMLASRASTNEICDMLHISETTLRNHTTNISDKLNGRGRSGIRSVLYKLQAVMVVPALFVCTSLGDGIVALQEML